MHTIQLALVDVNDTDLSDTRKLESYIDANLTGDGGTSYWWDWFAVGGRWDDYLTKEIGPMIWPNKLESPVALRLTKENWPLAVKLLENTMKQRASALVSYVENLKETGVDLNEYILELDTKVNGWQIPYYIKNIFALKCGDWTCDSGYVDLTNWQDASPERLLQYLQDPENTTNHWDGNNLDNYALVVVDFHF